MFVLVVIVVVSVVAAVVVIVTVPAVVVIVVVVDVFIVVIVAAAVVSSIVRRSRNIVDRAACVCLVRSPIQPLAPLPLVPSPFRLRDAEVEVLSGRERLKLLRVR